MVGLVGRGYHGAEQSVGQQYWACSPGRGIWSGMGKSSGTARGKKGLISPFACFLTAAAKVITFIT